MKPILNTQYKLYRKDSKVFCDSLQVAETFGRQHKHILDTIANLNQPTSGLSEEFKKENFLKSSYVDTKGRRYKKYLLTKDGFTMVVMEFKTAKARQFKEQYINRFNEMSGAVTVLKEVKEDFPDFTEAVKLAYAENKAYHYINEINMLYSLVLGQSVQSFKKDMCIREGSIREHLNAEQLRQFEKLQKIDIGLLMTVPDIRERKKLLTGRCAG